MNIARISLLVSISISAAYVVACSAPIPESSQGNSSRSASSGSRDPQAAGDENPLTEGSGPAAGKAGDAGPDSASGKGSGSGSSDKGGGGDKAATPADPACVSSCNSGLKAKCSGDATFCEDVCLDLTTAEISCLTAAPTCDKSEWVRCAPNPADDGSGSGSGKK